MLQVSQTGELGEALRSEERAYYNYPELVTPNELETFLSEEARFFGDRSYKDQGVTRYVLRAVLDGEASEAVFSNHKIARGIEAAAPIVSPSMPAGSSVDHVVYFANNLGWRAKNGIERKALIAQASPAVRLSRDIKHRDDVVNIGELPDEYRFTDIPTSVRDLANLWGETFGWNAEGCDRFRQQIEAQADVEPKKRSAWFQGIVRGGHRGTLVAAAMAERLDMPSSNGKVALVEHSEWSAHRTMRGQGLGKLTVHALTQRLQEDLRDTERLIFAECNLTSGAHVVAVRSGFKVPKVETAAGAVDQILKSHVRVGDGFEPRGAYRNFMFAVAE